MAQPIVFGQIIIGPPGSGKTTYCKAMQEFLTGLGRKVTVVNLDPANDILPYKCDVDISDLITVSDVMDNLSLGPNGGLLYCMEYLDKNIDWLQTKLNENSSSYVLIDCPGQVELYTHHSSVRNVLDSLSKWNYRLTAVHLVDSHYCSDSGKFIAVALTSLATMLQVELPHVNVLSKIDLVEQYGPLPFNLDFFTDVLDLQFLLDRLKSDRFLVKYAKLNEALAGLIQDYGLVSLVPLDIQKKDYMLRLLRLVDKANGYMFGELEERDVQALIKEKLEIDD